MKLHPHQVEAMKHIRRSMRLLPKDPFDASMSVAHVSMRSAKQRRKAYALELKAHGELTGMSHYKATERAEKKLGVRYAKKVNKLLEMYYGSWSFLCAMNLPRNQMRMINAVITADKIEQAIRHDELMYRNMF